MMLNTHSSSLLSNARHYGPATPPQAMVNFGSRRMPPMPTNERAGTTLPPRRRALPRHSRRVQPTSAVLGGLGNLFKADPSERTRKTYQDRVAAVNALEPSMQALSDEQLREKTQQLKARVAGGASLDDVLVEAFALIREASTRVLGLRPFDVQLIGGMVLHNGQIAEMRTGEGKTLVAVLPAFLNALSGKVRACMCAVNDRMLTPSPRACMWSRSTTTWLAVTASGSARCTAFSG